LNTSSIISPEKQERASADKKKNSGPVFYRMRGQEIFANCKTSSSVLWSCAKQRIFRWMRVGFSRQLLAKSPGELPGKLAAHEKEMIEAALRESGGRVFGPFGAAASWGSSVNTRIEDRLPEDRQVSL